MAKKRVENTIVMAVEEMWRMRDEHRIDRDLTLGDVLDCFPREGSGETPGCPVCGHKVNANLGYCKYEGWNYDLKRYEVCYGSAYVKDPEAFILYGKEPYAVLRSGKMLSRDEWDEFRSVELLFHLIEGEELYKNLSEDELIKRVDIKHLLKDIHVKNIEEARAARKKWDRILRRGE